jgi:hypothetical protein
MSASQNVIFFMERREYHLDTLERAYLPKNEQIISKKKGGEVNEENGYTLVASMERKDKSYLQSNQSKEDGIV